MYMIKNVENEIVIKNSRFIACLYKLNSIEDVKKYLNLTKKKYPKATHYTYGYRFENQEKSSDDHEPGGTAGIVILGVLQKEHIINCLCIVVRYFGGIKLGAGGLIRAYSKSCKEALNSTQKTEVEKGKKIKLTFNYNKEKEINYLLEGYNILDKYFNINITYTIMASYDLIERLKDFNYEILDDIYIEKRII